MKEDYTKYLSYDNGKGILISPYDKIILDRYQISYQNLNSLTDLILRVEKYLEEYEDEELEKQIRLQKKLLSDYNKLREAYYIDDKTYWKYMDIGLDKLSALLKRRNKK